MTKAAFTVWNRRIAPVFDVARQVHLVDAAEGSITGQADEPLPAELPQEKARQLAERGVDVLICGAISRPSQMLVQAYGIRIIPFVAGELDEVVQAWLRGTLEQGVFAMPGCCRRRQRFRGPGVGPGPGRHHRPYRW